MVNITNQNYDFTNVSQQADIYGFVTSVNDMTGQIFMIGILLVGWVILFISMKDYGNKEAFMSSGFIISVMSIMFSVLDFIPTFVSILIVVPYFIIFSAVATRD